MSDKPIPFSAPMVRALLREIEEPGTGKTQTRRVLKPQPAPEMGFVGIYAPRLTAVFGYETPDDDHRVALRHMPGDRLYVREAWRTWAQYDEYPPRAFTAGTHIAYEATPEAPSLGSNGGKLRPGMFLPRWASRITLIVTDVRVQRLQEISGVDAADEGVCETDFYDNAEHKVSAGAPWSVDRLAFADLWNSLNADRGYGWDSNPWVAAYTFRPILGNIDQIGCA